MLGDLRSSSYFFPVIIFLFSCFVGLVSVYVLPLSIPPSGHYQAALQILQQRASLASYFFPIGYPSILSIVFFVLGDTGIILFQFFVYVLTVITAYFLLRVWNASPLAALLCILPILLHPYLVININRIIDTNVTVFLFLVFLLFISLFFLRAHSFLLIVLSGFTFGFLASVRPNAFFLIGALCIFFVFMRSHFSFQRLFVFFVLFLFFTFFAFGLVSFYGTSNVFFFPKVGAYNLYAGANEYSGLFLLSRLNAENSIFISLPGFAALNFTTIPSATYRDLAFTYIREHPFEFARLGFLKFFTLFRPDYREVGLLSSFVSYAKLITQTILSFPLLFWFFAVCFRWSQKDFFSLRSSIVIFVLAFYLLPFLLSNADPRFRLPIDIVLLIDGAYRLFPRRHTQSHST